jgi:hypothetical protein
MEKKWKIGKDVLLLLSHNYHGNILNYEYNNEINTNPGVNQEEFTYLLYQYQPKWSPSNQWHSWLPLGKNGKRQKE